MKTANEKIIAETAELEGFIERLESEIAEVESSMSGLESGEISDALEMAQCVLALVVVKLTLLRIRMVARQRRDYIARVICGN